MKPITLIQSADVVRNNINSMLHALIEIDNKDNRGKETLNAFDAWRIQTSELLNELFTDESIRTGFLKDTKVLTNKFSESENAIKLAIAIERTKHYLERLNKEVLLITYEKRDESIDKSVALFIIRKLLKNFYKHIEAMYQADVHGKGSTLDSTRGDYYSLLRWDSRTIFPLRVDETAYDYWYDRRCHVRDCDIPTL